MSLIITERMSLIVGHLPFSDNSHFCRYSLYSRSLHKWNYSVSNLSCLTSFTYQIHPHCWVILYITGCYYTIWSYSNLLIFALVECHLYRFCVTVTNTVTLVWKEHASPSIMTPVKQDTELSSFPVVYGNVFYILVQWMLSSYSSNCDFPEDNW